MRRTWDELMAQRREIVDLRADIYTLERQMRALADFLHIEFIDIPPQSPRVQVMKRDDGTIE
jgi:hypothetical protein